MQIAGRDLAVLLLHGFCESSRIFDMIRPRLSAGHRVLCPDLPGHAGTAWKPEWHSLTDAADWLAALMDQEQLGQCVLIGHSLGGYIAAAFAEKYPDRLAGLCMLHSTAMPDPPTRRINRDKALDFIANHGTELFLKTFVQSLFHRPKPAWIAEMAEITASTDPLAITSLIRMMRDRSDRVDALRNLQVPVMYVTGCHDTFVPKERIQEELGRLGLALLHRLEDVGHMGMYEAPEKVLAAIDSLLRQVAASHA